MKRLLFFSIMMSALLLLPMRTFAGIWNEEHEVRCQENRLNCRILQIVMMGSFDCCSPEDGVSVRVLSAAFPQLCGISEEDIEHLCKEFGAEKEDVLENWHIALANALWADILAEGVPEGGMNPARLILLLFLDPSRESDSEEQMAQIRKGMTDDTFRIISEGAGVPEGFARWLIGGDDWQLHRAALSKEKG